MTRQPLRVKNENAIAKFRAGFDFHKLNLLGTIHSRGGLLAAQAILPGALDGVEIRLDELGRPPSPTTLGKITLPILATARSREEGGAGSWSARERRDLVAKILPWASAVDVELATARKQREFLADLQAAGCQVVLSFHDFKKTPAEEMLLAARQEAYELGADCFKAACFLRGAEDIRRLLILADSESPIPSAFMGMGPLGRASRLLCAGVGSALLYGWLHRPQVPGQWPALEMRMRFREAGVLPSE